MSWRFTPATHGGAAPISAGRSVGDCPGDGSVTRRAADTRIAASMALSQPGMPSRRNRPKPTPRG